MKEEEDVKERPILFSGPMVRAILDGRKAMTRRVVKDVRDADECNTVLGAKTESLYQHSKRCPGLCEWTCGKYLDCPYGQPGDRLWVREKFALSVCDPDTTELSRLEPRHWDKPIYAADGHPGNEWNDPVGNPIKIPWSPSIHMPRWASRIILEVTGVRVERLQDISIADAIAEGETARTGFEDLWNSINAKRGFGWDVNPWVWVIEFRRIKP